MIAELEPTPDPSITGQFGTLADEARVKRAAAALEANGIKLFLAPDATEAKQIVLSLIPEGAQVHHGASQSLEETGILDAVEKSGRYEHLRPRIWSMDRETQADEIRRLGAAPDVGRRLEDLVRSSELIDLLAQRLDLLTLGSL